MYLIYHLFAAAVAAVTASASEKMDLYRSWVFFHVTTYATYTLKTFAAKKKHMIWKQTFLYFSYFLYFALAECLFFFLTKLHFLSSLPKILDFTVSRQLGVYSVCSLCSHYSVCSLCPLFPSFWSFGLLSLPKSTSFQWQSSAFKIRISRPPPQPKTKKKEMGKRKKWKKKETKNLGTYSSSVTVGPSSASLGSAASLGV